MKRYLLPILLISALLGSSGVALRAPTVLAAGGQAAHPANPPRYTVADLGTLGGPLTEAMGINASGQVVGASQIGSYTYAFLWDDGTMTNLGALGAYGSWAYDINDAGQVVGGSVVGDQWETHAFRWQNGVMQDLGTLGGRTSVAFDINNSGQAVGQATYDTGLGHAVLWGSGGIVDLGDLDPLWPDTSLANGINDAGQVVGDSRTGGPGETHAFLWQNGAMQDLGTLGGRSSYASAINEDSKVVGGAWLSDEIRFHAFLWDGSMQDLGTLGWDRSIAYDINDAGQVVGALQQTGQNSHAFLWASGQMQDLNTLIPANSGWVLSEARAISNKGQIVGFGTINGQTHAFLLKANAYNWINPSGGAWHVTTNWDPQGDPGDGDTVIFGLSGQYTVDASVVSAASPTANFPVGRAIISGTNTVEFVNLSLNLLDDSVTEPALTVNDGGTVKITSGVGDMIHAVIGGAPPANPSNPAIARLQVFNSGTRLNGTGRLSIGDEGAGDLFVANGGQLTSTEARLGGAQPGTAVVGGDGSLWQTGSIAVGYAVSGTLTIENGGRVDSNTAVVGFGGASNGSQAMVDGAAPSGNQPSLWAIENDLTVGQGARGTVEVWKGGQLAVNQNIHILDGVLMVGGHLANGAPSQLVALDSILVGSANGGILSLYDGARGDIYGDLILGQSGFGAVILDGPAATGVTKLFVEDLQAGMCAIGREFKGEVVMHTRSGLFCRNAQLGQAGTTGLGKITMDGGYLAVSEILRVGQIGSGGGRIEMGNDAGIVASEGMHIAPNGAVAGTGNIFLGPIGLVCEGVLSLNIAVFFPPLAAAPQSLAVAQDTPATMAITGTLTIKPTGRLEIPLTGRNAGQYGSLAVTGTANLDGVLALDFRNGYAPRRGDTFTFVTATDGISGTFASVEISGLPPGFEYKLTTVDGHLKLEALNGSAPPQMVYLPLLAR